MLWTYKNWSLDPNCEVQRDFTKMYLLVPLYMLWIHIIVNLFIYMLFVREDDIYILYMNVVDLGLLCVRINQILCL